VIRIRVSLLDRFAAYLGDDDYPLGVLLRDLRDETPSTPAMARGHAFAKAMETLPGSLMGADGSMMQAEGHAFAFTCNAEIEAWPRRELRAEKDYGGITVSARCDRLHGTVIADDKTTSHFDAGGFEKYIDKWQWRYYLDIFGAQEFIWHIWCCREVEAGKHEGVHGWEVYEHHVIRNYRYPGLEEECREFAHEFKQFAEQQHICGA
jgi:hypothetical protein